MPHPATRRSLSEDARRTYDLICERYDGPGTFPTSNEISRELDISTPTAAGMVARLRQTGLVTGTRQLRAPVFFDDDGNTAERGHLAVQANPEIRAALDALRDAQRDLEGADSLPPFRLAFRMRTVRASVRRAIAALDPLAR